MTQQLAQSSSHVQYAGLKVGIVVARYEIQSVGALFNQAYEVLTQSGVAPEHISVISVPSSYDLAIIAQDVLARDAYDALICLGYVTKGARRQIIPLHKEHAQGLQWVALYRSIPVIFSVIDAEKPSDESIERGAECARTVLRIARVKKFS